MSSPKTSKNDSPPKKEPLPLGVICLWGLFFVAAIFFFLFRGGAGLSGAKSDLPELSPPDFSLQRSDSTDKTDRPAAENSGEATQNIQKLREETLAKIAPMVRLPGGVYLMGNDLSGSADQRPAHEVRLSPFEIDVYEVTNRQFRLFVDATGHITSAERRGWSYVFDSQEKSWVKKPGANWKTTAQNLDHAVRLDRWGDLPVVHVSYIDAVAFCDWAGKRLPSEAEWEYAARGGLIDAEFPWGNRREPEGRFLANYWQGWFPEKNTAADGFLFLAPVGSFPKDNYGLFDIIGNVSEWCNDRFGSTYYRYSVRDNPPGPGESESETAWVQADPERPEAGETVFLRVVRGGSFLSAENSDAAYKVSARSKQPENLSYEDLGFRCAK